MPIKITIKKTGRFKKIINQTAKNYISGADVFLKRKILSEMKKGKSPVKNGRWDKPYSKSYKAVLRGDVSFRKINGKVIPFNQPDLNIVGFRKRLSPVNLKLSGQLHSSFATIKRAFSLLMEFKDKVAVFHDRIGAGKKKSIHRMLPTRSGEKFNNEIDKGLSKILKNSLKKAIRSVRI